jgi:hypothetical protein
VTIIYTKAGIKRPLVIPMYHAVPVFIIKNLLRTAAMTRERYLLFPPTMTCITFSAHHSCSWVARNALVAIFRFFVSNLTGWLLFLDRQSFLALTI